MSGSATESGWGSWIGPGLGSLAGPGPDLVVESGLGSLVGPGLDRVVESGSGSFDGPGLDSMAEPGLVIPFGFVSGPVASFDITKNFWPMDGKTLVTLFQKLSLFLQMPNVRVPTSLHRPNGTTMPAVIPSTSSIPPQSHTHTVVVENPMSVDEHGKLGHLFPSIELCKLLSDVSNYKVTIVIPSSLASMIPHSDQLFETAELTQEGSDSVHDHDHGNMAQPFEDLVSRLSNRPGPPVCAIVDIMINWTKETCQKYKIPTFSFFTSSACSAAMELGLWKLGLKSLEPGKVYTLPGLPLDMWVTSADLAHQGPPPPGPHSLDHPGGHLPRPPHHHGGGPPPLGPPHRPGGGLPPPGPPPTPGGQPPWLVETQDSVAFLINTCADLERMFIDYVAKEMGKPVWGVGPLLPEQYWRSTDSLVHDEEIRSKRESNVREDEVKDWLDSKPYRSVIYVSFGTEVGPTEEELAELAMSLEESKRPFIWVTQSHRGGPGSDIRPQGAGDLLSHSLVDQNNGEGLVIRGWAPQLLILSHQSTAGFISHCGWNSTLEAIGRGVPLLTWPIRGDQHHNAKLVVSHLMIGLTMRAESDQGIEPVKKVDILRGIEKLATNNEIKNQATLLQSIFVHGFPASSIASLDAISDFISKQQFTSCN
ncbi:hypothetical protein GIB67_023912 [Kingdonia uniflora]|uniref:Glycosyltransferase n=1 Tax=Kingdonia uniflora TaxID=39325 RepID=A0A7J7NGU8_9MAGN|nr:hypothetical protein GIB67_023912 [Kingdonia uniflora]